MKKTLLAVAILTVFAAMSVQAQISYDAAISYDQITGDIGDAYTPGFGIGGDAFYSLAAIPNLGIGGRIAWNRFGIDEDTWKTDDGSMSIIEVLPSVRYSFTPSDSQFGFFGQVGLGMYFSSISVGDVDDSNSDFGFYFGGGVTGKFADTVSFFAMPLFHIINTENESTKYFSLNFGVMFQ